MTQLKGVDDLRDIYVFPAIFSFDDDGISVEFPDLPGCLTCGHTEEEAIAMAKEALSLHLWGMEDDGDEIPEPSRIADLELEKNQAAVLIEAWMVPFREKMATKAVNKMVTLPRWLIRLAEKENINFSQVLQSALKENLKVYDYTQLKKRST